MNHLESVFGQLRKEGIRLTPNRKAVVSVLMKSKKPICVEGIGSRLNRLGLSPDKVTLYRSVDFLVRGGWATALDLGGGRKCYEWASGHHHHLVCKKCNRIEELEAHEMEPFFAKFEKGLSRKSGFSDLSHSLEFYGVCNHCA